MSDYLVTADLAQRSDYTAAAIFRIDAVFNKDGHAEVDYWGAPLLRITCIGLERKRGMTYPDIVRWLSALLKNPKFDSPPLVLDGTSMGAPVFDMFRELRLGNEIVSVTATGGNTMNHANKSGYCWNVAKRMMVSGARTLIQQQRIKLLPGLELGDTAIKECLSYQLKISEDLKETYDAISGQHDDCVTTLLLAGWFLTAPCMRGLRPYFDPDAVIDVDTVDWDGNPIDPNLVYEPVDPDEVTDSGTYQNIRTGDPRMKKWAEDTAKARQEGHLEQLDDPRYFPGDTGDVLLPHGYGGQQSGPDLPSNYGQG